MHVPTQAGEAMSERNVDAFSHLIGWDEQGKPRHVAPDGTMTYSFDADGFTRGAAIDAGVLYKDGMPLRLARAPDGYKFEP